MASPLIFTPLLLCLLIFVLLPSALPLSLKPPTLSAQNSPPQQPPPRKDPRFAAIDRLFPGTAATLSKLFPNKSFSDRKRSALRLRVAQARAAVDRCSREIEALERRLDSPSARPPIESRLSTLRSEAGVAESKVLLLKARQRRMGLPSRKGLGGVLARALETFIAREEVSRVIVQYSDMQSSVTINQLFLNSLLRSPCWLLLWSVAGVCGGPRVPPGRGV